MLNPKQLNAISALLSTKTIREAASVANCSESAIYNWLSDDSEFNYVLNSIENNIRKSVSRRLKRDLPKVAEVVASVLRPDENTTRVRLDAAKCMYKVLHSEITRAELYQRLEILEEKQSNNALK